RRDDFYPSCLQLCPFTDGDLAEAHSSAYTKDHILVWDVITAGCYQALAAHPRYKSRRITGEVATVILLNSVVVASSYRAAREVFYQLQNFSSYALAAPMRATVIKVRPN